MRYERLGSLGYGLQILVYAASALLIAISPVALNLRGLDILGVLAPIPGLIISLTWIYAGRERKVGLFAAAGIIGAAAFASSVGTTLLYWAFLPVNFGPGTSDVTTVFELAAVSLLVSILALAFFVLETISFFSAGKMLNQRLLRIAGWSRIGAVIAAAALFIVIVLFGLLNILESSGSPPSTLVALQIPPSSTTQITGLFNLAYVGVYVVLAVPEAFAFAGFNRLAKAESAGVTPPAVPTSTRQCGSCGSPLSEGSVFCPNCGRSVI